MSMVQLTVLMGVPAAGKSTLVESMPNLVHISPDLNRERLTGSKSDQSRNAEVFQLAYDETRDLLNSGHDVIFDATNVQKFSRDVLLDIAEEAGAETRLIVLRVPFEECKARNLYRVHGRVPEHIMDIMHERFTRSLSEIGFERWDQIVNRRSW